MAGDRTLTVKILGDASSAQRALGQVDDATGKTEGRFARFGGVAKAAALGAGLAAIKFGKDSVDAFKDSEQAQSRLEAAFAKFPSLAGANIEALRSLNTELAKKTVYDDDATASGQAVLAGFKLTGEQLQTLTPLLQDYASRTGKDLPTAAQDLGKAILGQGRALKGIGVNFKDTGSEAGNFAQLTDVLRDKVGGFAEKEGKTAAGQAQILRNQFGELQEKVGSALVPALTKLADIGLAVVSFFQNLNPGVQVAIGVVAGLAVAVLAINKAIAAWASVQAALNAVLALNPIVLVVAAVAALAGGLVLAYQHSETFRKIVDGAFRGVATAAGFMKDVALGAIQFLVDKFLGAVEWIVKAAAKAFGWVPGVGDDLRRAAKEVERFRDDVNAKLDGIKDREVRVRLTQQWNDAMNVPAFMRRRAHGGPVRAGTPYLVGEEGPEVIVPGGSGMVIPNNRLATATTGSSVVNNYYTVHVAGSVTTERDLVDAVASGLEAKRRRNGPGNY